MVRQRPLPPSSPRATPLALQPVQRIGLFLLFFCLVSARADRTVSWANLRGKQDAAETAAERLQEESTTTQNHPQHPQVSHHHNLHAPPVDNFPQLEVVATMANLSRWVYSYKHYEDDNQCSDWNNQTFTKDVHCHWYRHDQGLGTQVMIVSSQKHDYLAVVFAGTDDLKTSLVDVDVRKIDFGTGDFDSHVDVANASRVPVALEACEECKVHAGFNNAVFSNHVFDDIYDRVETLRPKFTKLYTTGHSLGAANSVLTALALALEFQKQQQNEQPTKMKFPVVTSLNFGCPQVGNQAFQDFVNQQMLTHDNHHHTQQNPFLQIWRFVLGWDLVPRLPEFFYHVGHTVQMHHPECNDKMTYCEYLVSTTEEEAGEEGDIHQALWLRYNKVDVDSESLDTNDAHWSSHFPHWNWWHHHHRHSRHQSDHSNSNNNKKKDDSKKHNKDDNKNQRKDDDDNTTQSALAYYHHTGNETLHYAGVPTGWSAKPYLWVPGALWSHAISRYAEFLNDWYNVSASTWVRDFVHVEDTHDDDSNNLIDDDTYNEPPDDDAAALMVVDKKLEEEESLTTVHFVETLNGQVVDMLWWRAEQ